MARALLWERDAGLETARRGPEEDAMLYYSLIFLIVAVIAGFFGFGGVATAASGIAQILFFVFLVGFIITAVAGGMTRAKVRSPRP